MPLIFSGKAKIPEISFTDNFAEKLLKRNFSITYADPGNKKSPDHTV